MAHRRRIQLALTLLAILASLASASRCSAQPPPKPTPPFDTSPEAVAARAAFYGVPGRTNLTQLGTPLAPGTRIDFFGDSLTWLNGYVTNIRNAINTGPGTAGQGIVCTNRGIDGAGVLQMLNGEASTRGFGGITPQPFATTIAADQADVAVVFIGINDVWWRNTPAATFRQGLETIVDQANAAGVTMVLATLAVNGEKPDGTNPNDAVYDQFAQLTRDVAADTGITLVDLRRAFIEYEMNNNQYQFFRGSGWQFQTSGILTYDGIHASALGNTLLSDLLADGIYRSLLPAAVPEPAASTLLAFAAFTLSCGRRLRRRSGPHLAHGLRFADQA